MSSELIFSLSKPSVSIWFTMFQFCFNQDTFAIFHLICVGVTLQILAGKLEFLSFVFINLAFGNTFVSVTVHNFYEISFVGNLQVFRTKAYPSSIVILMDT